MSLKAIIVEDEKNAMNLLKNKINELEISVDVIGSAPSIREAKELIEKKEFDILFLDIELREGNGFDLIESLEKVNFEIIFTTAYNQFAIDAFKVNALDYLLKPIDTEELNQAVHRAQKRIESKSENIYDRLSDMINSRNSPSKLALKERGKITFVDVDEILYLKADGVYTEIITKKNKHVSSNNLGYFEGMLNSDYFSRVHRSYIINIKEVKEYFTSDHTVKLSDGSLIPVSGASLKGFLEGI